MPGSRNDWIRTHLSIGILSFWLVTMVFHGGLVWQFNGAHSNSLRKIVHQRCRRFGKGLGHRRVCQWNEETEIGNGRSYAFHGDFLSVGSGGNGWHPVVEHADQSLPDHWQEEGKNEKEPRGRRNNKSGRKNHPVAQWGLENVAGLVHNDRPYTAEWERELLQGFPSRHHGIG